MTNHHKQASPAAMQAARAVQPALRDLMAGRETLAERFQHFQNAFHEEGLVEPKLLELCRTRLDALHGVAGNSTLDKETAALVRKGQFASFTALEQQALSVTEQLAIDAHGVTDTQVKALNLALGAPAAVSLLTAASMHDAAIRMQSVLQQNVNAKDGAHQ